MSVRRDNWPVVKFGDVVENVNLVERNPLEAGLERFVGLEHMDRENLHIRRWGRIEGSETTFTKRFRNGQVLFGKRRAYQRKVAVAEFDGICSSDILTFDPKGDALIPELLPFIVQSDGFFEHALGTSAGSLSPRTRWSQLADYAFPLPPKDEQRRIAEILWAADEATTKYNDLQVHLRAAKRAAIDDLLGQLTKVGVAPLCDLWVGSPESGYSPTPASADTGRYVLTLSALSRDGYRPGNLKPVTPTGQVDECMLHKGDFLVSRSNTVELVGLVGIFGEDRDDVSFPDLMMRIPLKIEKISARYLELVMLSSRGRMHMARVAAGTSGSMKKINRTGLGAFEVPLPSRDVQDSIADRAREFDCVGQTATSHRQALARVKSTLVNTLLLPGRTQGSTSNG